MGLPTVSSAAAAETVAVPNPGFETPQAGTTSTEHWKAEIGGGAKATVERDDKNFHNGKISIRITNQSPTKAFVFASLYSDILRVRPQTTYVMRFFAKGKKAKNCFASVSFEGDGERRLFLSSGDFDWKEFACQFTTPEKSSDIRLRFASDGITDGLWIDDVSLEVSPKQLVNLEEKVVPKDFDGFFPRSKGPVAKNLVVFDLNRESDEVGMMLAALQGIVNRRQPRIYLVNKTNPTYYDEVWFKYMQEKGYTGREERMSDPWALVQRFKSEIAGVIIYDTELPGSLHAARMLAGVKNALPVSPDLAAKSGLPVVMDLRGKWKRNVDAYRFVFDNYWDQMTHHVIAWEYPLSKNNCCLDYITQFKVPCFWVSTYSDNEKGADPPAEEEFLNDLLAATPGNVPCMGWPMQGDDKGVQEYSGVRWLSEYGKWMPGTGFNSNMSVHSAIHPPDSVFRQKFRRQPSNVKLEDDKVYVTVNIMDSGDALWYWLFHQRKIWADPVRGLLPIG
ncbi:MAG: GxGYxYP family putative glycoside hydrolase, partial [Candidatus Sumerlaeota bacterium]|nr:GxGYxYP family putative glycoside hydrolase [Candidatus Sumerlaeota bacterium]